MKILPDPAPDDDDAALTALRERFPEWDVRYEAALHVWTAELRSADGKSLRFLAGHTLNELAVRLETATTVAQ
jgi:hypothetical protein